MEADRWWPEMRVQVIQIGRSGADIALVEGRVLQMQGLPELLSVHSYQCHRAGPSVGLDRANHPSRREVAANYPGSASGGLGSGRDERLL